MEFVLEFSVNALMDMRQNDMMTISFHSLQSVNIFGHSLPRHLMLDALIFPSKPLVPNVHLVNIGLVPKTRGG